MTDLERAHDAIQRAGLRYGLSVSAVRVLAQAALDAIEQQRQEAAAAVHGQAQGLGKEHVQQPIAGMAPLGPTRTEPSNPLRPIEPGPKPIYQMTSRELRDKLRQEQWQQALVVEQPKPEHWEVCHMAFPISHPGWLTQVTPGWEPFAVYNGVLWLKRRVP